VGVKIDFMDSESKTMIDFYEACLREGAANRLMIDFHGANKPTGEARTWPNEVTREGVRGLEYKMVFADHTATLPFTRYLAGHADYTPMYFQKDHMGNTSFAHQLASAVFLGSPVTFFGDDPENYLNSPARDAIEAMPIVWDETVVLEPSKIGRLAAFARRSGGGWFVAVLNAGGKREIEIPLDFLGEGKYKAVAYFDVQANPMEMRRAEAILDSSGRLPVRMRAAGGFLAMLKKAGGD
ncbi:MAG: glycoside hydrolase family 97 catalytic domain-containing protein, partial [bacterium]